MLARAAHRRHGYVETKLKERVASLEKIVDLKARNKELSGQVGSLEASIAKHKALVEDAEACLSRNVDLNAELKRKDEDLRKAEDSRKKAEELAEENAKKLEGFRAALLACMQEAKVAINTAFVKGGMESSGVLPEADPAAF
jgi:peptidoglycan hydrolase CwlO-like protein